MARAAGSERAEKRRSSENIDTLMHVLGWELKKYDEMLRERMAQRERIANYCNASGWQEVLVTDILEELKANHARRIAPRRPKRSTIRDKRVKDVLEALMAHHARGKRTTRGALIGASGDD
jgi:hypothetical protein